MKESILKNLAGLAAKKLLAHLVSKAPFLGAWFINPIASFLITHLVTLLFEKTYLGAMLIMIRIETDRELNALETVIKEIQDHEGDLTDEETKAFDDRLDSAGRDIINLGLSDNRPA